MSSFPFTSGKLATAVSLNADGVVGKVFEAQRISKGSVQFIITGTFTGNVLIQASNVIVSSGDKPYSTADADWVTVDTTALTGASGSIMANFDTFGSHFLRVYVDYTSGSATADAWFCFKA